MSDVQERVIVAEMLASNQFKINGTGEAPTVYSGTMGTYDSDTDSYYFENNCGMDWTNWSALGMTLEKAQRLTKLEFEWEGLIRDTSYGRDFDVQIQPYFNSNLLFIEGIADGYYDASSDYQRVARIKNEGADRWQTDEIAPLNNSQYQGSFHKIKWVWEIDNNVAKECIVYLDGNIYSQNTSINYSFSITALGSRILRFATIDHTNVKYLKVAFYFKVISPSGGAGSGYIGNSLVSNKKMVGYNVPTSDTESTKTESVNEASESPVSGKPKIGNGYAKIKLVREVTEETIFSIVASSGTTDLITGTEPTILTGSALPSYDSNEDALTVSNATAILYTNIVYKEFTRRAKRIEFNAVAKIKSYSSSYQGITSFFVRIGSIFFIFSRELSKVLIRSDSNTFTHYAEPAILNDLTLNTFYNVKAVFHLNGSYKITKMQTYVNGTLTWENTFSTPLDLYNGDLQHVWVHIADGDCYLRSADVKIYMNEGA